MPFVSLLISSHIHSDTRLQEECGELHVDVQDVGHFMNVMKTQVLGNRLAYGYRKDKGDNVEASKWMWKTNETHNSPWFEYYWRDVYLHHIWSYGKCVEGKREGGAICCVPLVEALLDPYAQSYNPDYLHHH